MAYPTPRRKDLRLMTFDDLMTTAEAAELLRVSEGTLLRWRSEKKGPPYVRFEGTVRYSRASLNTWLERKVVDA